MRPYHLADQLERGRDFSWCTKNVSGIVSRITKQSSERINLLVVKVNCSSLKRNCVAKFLNFVIKSIKKSEEGIPEFSMQGA